MCTYFLKLKLTSKQQLSPLFFWQRAVLCPSHSVPCWVWGHGTSCFCTLRPFSQRLALRASSGQSPAPGGQGPGLCVGVGWGGVGMRTKFMVSCGDLQADGSSQQFCPKAEGDGCLDVCRLPAWPLSSVGALSGQCFSEHDSGHGSVIGLQEGQCPPEDLPQEGRD